MDEVEEIQLLSSEDGGEEEQPQGPSGSGSEKAALLKQLEATNVEIKKVHAKPLSGSCCPSRHAVNLATPWNV